MQVADLFANLRLSSDAGSFARGDKLIEGIKKGLEIFAAVEVVRGITEIFKSVSETAIAADRMAQKIGVSSEAVQELGYAASTTGVSTEELQIGFTKMAKGLEEFREKGTGPVGEALVKLKVPLDAIKNDGPDEVLGQIADRFADMPDGIKKTGLAMEVFGKSGANLIPFLNKGGDGIKELREEAEDLGIVIDGKTSKAFEGLEESSLKIKGSITGFKNTLAVALLPTIQKVADSLFGWIKANKEVISADIKAFVEGLVVAFTALSDAVDFVAQIFRDAWAGDEGAQAILIGVAAVIASVVVPALWAMTVPIILASLPLIAIVAVVALIALGVMKIVKHWDAVKAGMHAVADWFVGVGHSIVSAFSTAWDAVKSAAKAAFEWIINLPVVKQLIELYDYFKRDAAPVEQQAADTAYKNFTSYGGVASVYGGTLNGQLSPANSVSPGSGAAANGNTTVNNTITVNAPNANADEVASKVQDKITEHWNSQMRDAKAGSGGGEQ